MPERERAACPVFPGQQFQSGTRPAIEVIRQANSQLPPIPLTRVPGHRR